MQIELCESIEGLVRSERLAREAADNSAQEWQKQIKKGDCFRRLYYGLEIYGEVLGDYGGNFRICHCYSFVCPEGEIGRVHVSTIDHLIDRQAFEKVRDKLGKAWRIAKMRLKNEAKYEEAAAT